MRARGERRFGLAAVAIPAVLFLGTVGVSALASVSQPNGNAGVCVKLDNAGHVIAAKITETSGDQSTDAAIVELATQVHWDKPYPRAGWMPMRLGVGNEAESLKPTPPCDQSVQAAAAPATAAHHHRRRVIRAVSAEGN